MLNISPFGMFHTLIGVIAVAAGVRALVRHRQIDTRHAVGRLYVWMTVATCVTGFFIFQHGGFGKPHALGVITLAQGTRHVRETMMPALADGLAEHRHPADPPQPHLHVHAHGDYVHSHVHGHDPDTHGHTDTPQGWLDRKLGGLTPYQALRPVAVGHRGEARHGAEMRDLVRGQDQPDAGHGASRTGIRDREPRMRVGTADDDRAKASLRCVVVGVFPASGQETPVLDASHRLTDAEFRSCHGQPRIAVRTASSLPNVRRGARHYARSLGGERAYLSLGMAERPHGPLRRNQRYAVSTPLSSGCSGAPAAFAWRRRSWRIHSV